MPDSGLQHEPDQASPGLLHSLRKLAATVVSLLQTRLELIVTDLEEERERAFEIVFWALGALFFLGIGVLVLALLGVLVLWEQHRVGAIVGLGVALLAIGVGLGLRARSRIHGRPRLFAATMKELSKDREHLTSR